LFITLKLLYKWSGVFDGEDRAGHSGRAV
jgi:hypothetical protein